MKMDMTTNAIKTIQEMAVEAADKKLIEKNERIYSIDGDGEINEVFPHNLAKTKVELNTLIGLVDFIKSMNERKNQQLYVHVKSANCVKVYTHLDEFGRREYLAQASAILPEISYADFYDSETANIMFQANFKETKDRDLILKVIGNLKEEHVQQANDDGVSQSVSVQTGVATVGKVKVPNPVQLAPYRTFNEVEQPTSKFIFRMKQGMQCAIFEADNKAWQLKAMSNIKQYLTKELANLIAVKHVVVIA